ncbi:DUF1853 family protein [Kangiella sp. TOML190]|uniref:DUF1853 family protein n=1 Tax=Kangiella sp. TOML190 TaxID=2931351 RepID=UPI00203A867D|nr:DUF1853 family protein [Kangiella sp. TOML190]
MRFHADQQWLLDSPELLALDATSSVQPLLDLLIAKRNFEFEKTHRLGIYFEQLWFNLLTTSSSIESLEQNLQIIIDKQTLGEFDSIIKYQNQIIHCELAVKFYLNIGIGSSLSDWVGPNLKDRFDNKYQRLFQHQLQLSEQPAVKPWLSGKGIIVNEKRLLTRGRLFYPWTSFVEQSFCYPKQVNEQHLKGFWIEYTDLSQLIESTDYHWYQLPRFYWLAEVSNADLNELLPVAFDFEGFSLQKIVAVKDGIEVMRGFVVNQDWLDKAQLRVQAVS